MISQAPLNFPDQLGEDGKRPTPILVIAAVIGALAIVLIAVIVLNGGGASPSHSPSPTASGPTGSNTPKPSKTPGQSGGPTSAPSGSPTAVDGFAAEVCTSPVAPYDQLSESLLGGFREYCAESITRVTADESIDPATIGAAGWAFTIGDPGAAGGAAVSRVFVAIDGETKVRSYLVTHQATGDTAILGTYVKVRRVADPQLVFSWTRP